MCTATRCYVQCSIGPVRAWARSAIGRPCPDISPMHLDFPLPGRSTGRPFRRPSASLCTVRMTSALPTLWRFCVGQTKILGQLVKQHAWSSFRILEQVVWCTHRPSDEGLLPRSPFARDARPPDLSRLSPSPSVQGKRQSLQPIIEHGATDNSACQGPRRIPMPLHSNSTGGSRSLRRRKLYSREPLAKYSFGGFFGW